MISFHVGNSNGSCGCPGLLCMLATTSNTTPSYGIQPCSNGKRKWVAGCTSIFFCTYTSNV